MLYRSLLKTVALLSSDKFIAVCFQISTGNAIIAYYPRWSIQICSEEHKTELCTLPELESTQSI